MEVAQADHHDFVGRPPGPAPPVGPIQFDVPGGVDLGPAEPDVLMRVVRPVPSYGVTRLPILDPLCHARSTLTRVP